MFILYLVRALSSVLGPDISKLGDHELRIPGRLRLCCCGSKSEIKSEMLGEAQVSARDAQLRWSGGANGRQEADTPLGETGQWRNTG